MQLSRYVPPWIYSLGESPVQEVSTTYRKRSATPDHEIVLKLIVGAQYVLTLVRINLENTGFLDNVCLFSIRLKKLTHVIRVNRFRRGGQETRGHQLETQFVCKK